tara:strand:- start:1551 stop:3167 length:1617 start_codon:yes stop_codon:yes gene_type:complete
MAHSALRNIAGALNDPQFRSEVGNNFMTAVNRGAVGMTLGAPVDIVNSALNLGLAGYGYLGNKLGLLTPEQMPALNNEPFGGSEWIGKQMERAGIINSNRNLPAEMIAGSVLPFAPVAMEARIPQMVRGLDQLAANYNAPRNLNTSQYMSQRGAVKITPAEAAAELQRRNNRNISGAIPVVTKKTGFLQRAGDVESVNSMNVQMTPPKMPTVPIVKAEDLIDRPLMTGITDTTRAGLETVEAVNNVPMNAEMLGGMWWGFQPIQRASGQAFSSADTAVIGQLNRAKLAQELSKRQGVVYVPHGMRGKSPDYSTLSTDIAIPYARSEMSALDKAHLDKTIIKGVPSWRGIDNATPEYLSSIGGQRKIVLNALDDFRDRGSLNLSQIRAIITDPNQVDVPWGDVNAAYLLDPAAYMNTPIVPKSPHPSYSGALSGTPLGAFREATNILEFNPMIGTESTGEINFLQEMARRKSKAQQNLQSAMTSGDKELIGKAQTNFKSYDMANGKYGSSIQGGLKAGGHGVFTQSMIDDLIKRGLVLP